jgi:hypothetical protein
VEALHGVHQHVTAAAGRSRDTEEGRAMEAKGTCAWTATGRANAVIRLLKGEEAATVAGEVQVPLDELLKWRDVFLQSGTEALARRGGGGELPETTGAEAVPEAFPDDLDWAPLDWQLDGERLGWMVTKLGELISRQQKPQSR